MLWDVVALGFPTSGKVWLAAWCRVLLHCYQMGDTNIVHNEAKVY